MAEQSSPLSSPHEEEAKEVPRSIKRRDTSKVGKDKDQDEKVHARHDEEAPPRKKFLATETSSPLPACKTVSHTSSRR